MWDKSVPHSFSCTNHPPARPAGTPPRHSTCDYGVIADGIHGPSGGGGTDVSLGWRPGGPVALAPARAAGAESRSRAARIDERTREVLRLMATGMKDDTIARVRGVSRRTAQKHVSEAGSALEAKTRFQIGQLVMERGRLGGPSRGAGAARVGVHRPQHTPPAECSRCPAVGQATEATRCSATCDADGIAAISSRRRCAPRA